tara:strand:- start:13442 stop:14554 length:1113 start_codon:yes stop_codon:yes gene_type:complete
LRIIITGQEGFIGYHLYNSLKYRFPELKLLDFKRSFFKDENLIDKAFNKSDIIIHLAGVNRSQDQDYLFSENISLGQKIIKSLKRINFQGKLIFASSTQEELSNHYGKAKKTIREFFFSESVNCGFDFIGLIIPNVYGPFCRPNYNSFISTFSKNLIDGIKNSIIEDKQIPLIYVGNLINKIISSFNSESNPKKIIKEDTNIKVSEVNKILEDYNQNYFINGIIPDLNTQFKKNLFLTYISYIPLETYFPKNLQIFSDKRGLFGEVIRSEVSGQTSFSVTHPNQLRGDHFHTKKIERFTVISGEATIEIRKVGTNSKKTFKLNGNEPSYIDMFPWYSHNIKNTGSAPLITLFWINEFFNQNEPDTYIEKV